MLPSGYKRLEYIQSSGTQYIDTGYKADQNRRVVMDVQPLVQIKNAWLFEGRNTSTQARSGIFFYYSSTKLWTSDWPSDRQNFSEIAETDRLLIDANKTICTVNGYSLTHTEKTFQSDYTLTLLACNTGGTISGYANAKLYSCQIYDNGTLIRDFIPCQTAAGEIGLWDNVNSVFYGNSGTGSFIAGPEVYFPVYTPAIAAISIAPNPAHVGDAVLISVSAIDVEVVPSKAMYLLGEFQSGEV